jgi:hypothetical protein
LQQNKTKVFSTSIKILMWLNLLNELFQQCGIFCFSFYAFIC